MEASGIICANVVIVVIAIIGIFILKIELPRHFTKWQVICIIFITIIILFCIVICPRISFAGDFRYYVEEDKYYVVKSKTIRDVTAYNVGDPAQTDSTPCISASNQNICKALEAGELHCAANFVPLGTKLHIENIGICTVTDRMNRRYKNRVDIAMPKNDNKKACEFGRQKLLVVILKQIQPNFNY